MATSKQDWLQQGLAVLGQVGVKGLTIDGLAEVLGVTKGSFYHHFSSMADYKQQLMAFWADQYLATVGSLPPDAGQALLLLDQIMKDAFSIVTLPEIAIRGWARQNAMVQAYVAQADTVRYDFLRGVFLKIVNDEVQANLMADILFTLLIGSLSVIPRFSAEQVVNLYAEFKRLYGLEVRSIM